MRLVRSLLFIPGNRPTWFEKALVSEADGLILDLEDSVPEAEKDAARAQVRHGLLTLHAQAPTLPLLIRPNALDTGLTGEDLEATVVPGLAAILAPKVASRDDVREYAALVAFCERRARLGRETVEIVPTIETAAGYRNAYDIAVGHPRVRALLGAIAPGGDSNRSLGFVWTRDESETLYVRAKLVLDARAAGVRQVLAGLWTDIRDLDGLAQHARQNRHLGYTGEAIIHPSHAPVVNDIYAPHAEELAYYRGLLAAMAEAERRGLASVTYQGQMVDLAMVKTAREVLAFARDIGVLADDEAGDA
ncbi:MAG: CoA ester lyase [Chloroflexi bacterium]|nr:CoA ester lyase [Chloroflexota bacterium]